MRTKYIEIYERSRLARASDAERYSLKLKVFGSLAEIEKIREDVLKQMKVGSE